jgi:hypothetical protein
MPRAQIKDEKTYRELRARGESKERHQGPLLDDQEAAD